MILTNRLFHRQEPRKDAKCIYIYCEGRKREFKYFSYFEAIDSRIKIQVHLLKPGEDNSPNGLFKLAEKDLVKTDENPKPKYELLEIDEVWIVCDRDFDKLDSRAKQFTEININLKAMPNWYLSISNPCFEVWLYYHIESDLPSIESMDISNNWKKLLNDSIKGGFDSSKHPIYIGNAIVNSKNNYTENDGIPDVASTAVWKIGESFYPLLKDKIDKILSLIDRKSNSKEN